jgi:hypothetical protein
MVALIKDDQRKAVADLRHVNLSTVIGGHAQRAKTRGWPVLDIATGHEAMVTAPDQLAKLLLHIAA